MSETSILPGATPAPVADTTGVPVPPEFDNEPTDDRRRLMIIGGVVAAVIVAIATYFLLHKSSSSDSSFPPVPHGVAPSSAPAAGQHAGKAGHGKSAVAKTLPKRATALHVRDPFKPLVVAPSDTGGTQQGTTTTVSAPPVAPSSAPSAPVVIPTSQPTTGTTSTTTPSGRPLWIRLVSINGTKSATFDVGYPHHKFHRFRVLAPSAGATRGTVFDKIFALIGIQGGTATVQIADGTPFDLIKGVAHSV